MFLDKYHETLYSLALSLRKNQFKVWDFTYVETSDPRVDYVIGEDRKGEEPVTYVLSVPKGCEDLRRCLGFSFMYYESFPFTSGVSIGVLDMAVKVIKTFKDEGEMMSYLRDEEVKQFKATDYLFLKDRSRGEGLYQRFISSLNDRELNELNDLARGYLEAYRLYDRNPEASGLDETVREIERRLLAVSSGYERVWNLNEGEHISEDEEHIEGEVREPLDVFQILSDVRAEKFRENVSKFLDFAGDEERSWESVRFRGSLLNVFERRAATILIRKPGFLTIDKAGGRTIPVQPSLIEVERLV